MRAINAQKNVVSFNSIIASLHALGGFIYKC